MGWEQLYPVGDGDFEFQRTVSRLMEMQSAAYIEGKRPMPGRIRGSCLSLKKRSHSSRALGFDDR